jgi:von Willebrand factor type A domain
MLLRCDAASCVRRWLLLAKCAAKNRTMPNHIVIILDHSRSMQGGFSGALSPGLARGLPASHRTKIEEAKSQLIAWLMTSDYDEATLIPFSSDSETPARFSLPKDLNRAKQFLEQIVASGSTNLASALTAAIDIGLSASEDWFVRFLIVTDGLSDTRHDDLGLVQRIPSRQGVDALLIDPTPEGEAHLRSLCIRGRYIPVYGASDLEKV